MYLLRKSKIKKIFFGIFLPLFFTIGIFSFTPFTHSQGVDPNTHTGEGAVTQATIDNPGSGFSLLDPVGKALSIVFKTLLLGIFYFFAWLASVAVTIFDFVLAPGNISGPNGLLNLPAVYSLWKFIRDFFNLFFILVLLFSAFATIFQYEQYSIRKIFLNVLLAALLINFSFPIARFMVDMTNVPMYYFIDSTKIAGSNGPTGVLGTFLGASQLKDILLPKDVVFDSDVGISHVLAAIIFMFILAVSLLVLAVMMLVRLVALVILLIFSPFGFAASIVPGMGSYGEKWWSYFWKYSLFGPAAALMLFISIRFLAEVSQNNAISRSINSIAGDKLAGSDPSFIAAMALFSVPIILIWFTLGLANEFSIAGADKVTGWGRGFAKGGLKKIYNNPVGRGLYGGAKKVASSGKIAGFDYGSTRLGKFATGDYWATPSKTEAFIKGGITGRFKGSKTEIQKAKDKAINEQVKKDKEENLSRSGALKRLDSKDEIQRAAAAVSLANMDNGIQSMEDLTKALNALPKDKASGGISEAYQERALSIISKADKEVITESRDANGKVTSTGLQNLKVLTDALGNNQKAVKDLVSKLEDTAFSGTGSDYANLLSSPAFTGNSAAAAKNRENLERKVKKEGEVNVLIDYNVKNAPQKQDPETAVRKAMESMKADEIAEQTSLFTGEYKAIAKSQLMKDPQRMQEVRKKARGVMVNVLDDNSIA